MYFDYEGYWYISRQCIMEMLGDRITDVLHAIQELKKELVILVNDPAKIDPEVILSQYKNEIVLAFQMDVLCQSSLEIRGDEITIYTINDGEEQLRLGDIVQTEYKAKNIEIYVVDREDQERSLFICTDEKLETNDKGMILSFSREPTFFFSDLELDALEKIVRRE